MSFRLPASYWCDWEQLHTSTSLHLGMGPDLALTVNLAFEAVAKV